MRIRQDGGSLPRARARLLHTQRMATSTFRRMPPERPVATTYWRRRCITLVLGLSILALVAWAFSGSLGSSAPPAPAAAANHRSGGPTRSLASPAGGASHTPAASPSPGPPRHGEASTTAGLLPCPAGAVVLSLFSSQSSYSTSQTPQFDVDVVSTAARACTFDIGSAHVVLRISAGALPIWSSGECAEGQSSLVTELRRGIPTVVSIGWDGQHSTPGCPVPGAPAADGTYTAVGADGSLRSNALAFRIG
jgi:hypothetical protein